MKRHHHRIETLEREASRTRKQLAPIPVRLAEGGSGGETTGGGDVLIVLIDADIEGIDEYDPASLLEAADIPLTEAEIEDDYTVIFQDPPDDDYDENQVDTLNRWAYKRREAEVKYFETDPESNSGTATDGDTASITLEAGASTIDDFYNGDTISLTGGTGSGQTATILDYNGATLVATVSADWDTPPDNTTEYSIASSLDKMLAITVIDDADNFRKIVRYATQVVLYDDGQPFTVGEYTRADYPDFDENAAFPPEGLPEGFLNKRYRGLAVKDADDNWVLVTSMCKVLPAPPLPEEEE